MLQIYLILFFCLFWFLHSSTKFTVSRWNTLSPFKFIFLFIHRRWGSGYHIFKISFCGGNASIDNLIWRNSGISTNKDFSHVRFQTLGFAPPVLGGLWCHVCLSIGSAWSLLYQGQLFGSKTWGCYHHLVVPSEAGKSSARVRNWSPLHMWHSLLAPRGLSLTTVIINYLWEPFHARSERGHLFWQLEIPWVPSGEFIVNVIFMGFNKFNISNCFFNS